MRNKFLVGSLCICALLLAVGCSSEAEVKDQSEGKAETAALSEQIPEKDTQKNVSYEDLIASVKDCMENVNFEAPWEYDFSSAVITTGSSGTPGYLIMDLDGNGVDELIFGVNETDPETMETWDGIVYNIYTISDGAFVQVLNGWERNRYYLCENGMIANEGSSGAANFSYAYFTFEGSKLHLVESVIYDGMKDADHPWFYSTESEYDAASAEPISEERAIEIREKYTYEHPAFVPFVRGSLAKTV